MSSEIDYWDGAARTRMFTYLLGSSQRLIRLYPNHQEEMLAILGRHRTAWAKEMREMQATPPDAGDTVWRYRMVQAEQEMSVKLVNLKAMPKEQGALL